MPNDRPETQEKSLEELAVYSIEENKTIGLILYWISLIVLIAISGLLVLFLTQSMNHEAVIDGIALLCIVAALVYIRLGRFRVSAALISVILIVLVTILATIGQGIHDIGVVAFPSILIIASLLLRRRAVIFLSILTILCTAWLVAGEMFGLFIPLPIKAARISDFLIVGGILIVTAIAVQLLSHSLQNNLMLRSIELQQRLKTEKALREAETMYRTLVEQISVVTYRDTATPEAESLYISPQIKDLIGYTQKEWLSDPGFWRELVHPDDLPHVFKTVSRYIESKEKSVSEFRLRAKNGAWVWVRDEAMVVKDNHGKPLYVQGVYIDITEQKKAESTVKQREAILAAVAETAQLLLKSRNWRDEIDIVLKLLGEATGASHVYIFENHPSQDGIVRSSQKYEWTMPGMIPELDNLIYQNTRLIPMPGIEDWYESLSHGRHFYGSGKQYPKYWEEVFEKGGLKTLLDMPIIVEGKWWGIIGFDDFINEMPWSQAEIDALIAAAGNISVTIERQQADEALRASEEKFQRVFHYAIVPMVIGRSKDGVILDANDAFRKRTGYTSEEVIGKTSGEINLWEKAEERDSLIEIVERKGYADEVKVGFRRKDGVIRVGLVSVVEVQIGDEPCRLFTFIDISEIDQLLNELKAKNEELQSFTYTVSHDLKAPLVTIAGFLGYLEQDAEKGELERIRTDAQRIREALAKMQRLLSELLELSRIGRLMNPPEEIPFGEIVREALSLVEGRLRTRQVQVKVEAGLPSVYGDRARLVEVIQNLVDNAAKFMGDQKEPLIEIGVDELNGDRIFFVRDNGIGIPPEQTERIFGLFNKLDIGSEGTGIGLSLVKRIIEVHGGKIWVKSEPGSGATFFFTLANKPQ